MRNALPVAVVSPAETAFLHIDMEGTGVAKRAACVESLRELVDEPQLKWLGSEEVVARGRSLFENGKVAAKDAGSVWVDAAVCDGASSYDVELAVLHDGDLHYKCNCPAGAEELFCPHCAATGLFWLSRNFDGETGVRDNQNLPIQNDSQEGTFLSDLRATLEPLDRSVLVELLLDCAIRDPALPGRVEALALVRSTPADLELELQARDRIDEIFDENLYVPFDRDEIEVYPDSLLEDLPGVFDSVAQRPEVTVKLADYCLEKLDESIDAVRECCDGEDRKGLGEVVDFLDDAYLTASGLRCPAGRLIERAAPRKRFPALFRSLGL